MNAVLSPAQGGLAAVRAQLRARWRSLAQRERRLVAALAAVLAVAVVWLLLVQPAWRTLRSAPAEIDRLEAQLQQMRREATETAELRNAPRINLTQASAALRASTERLGEHGKLQVIGDRATLTLTNANGDELRRWLAEARSGARARPVEANLTRGPQGHSGTLVVALPGNNP
ncbi:type II secretion system protein M [Aquincola tertiaricarbonis]|uniref:Type II secretion system protein M n=1 Tax=Aquincola tertiaricarbonis TaxID=391953 RepID=A0ABY4SBA6_AQUTE|nr:type II secretion system protein GspM [Aquincola tertiaricarbonis]URI10628.1 type II secretion system protein M [Aquincola tertiaricarbonis]